MLTYELCVALLVAALKGRNIEISLLQLVHFWEGLVLDNGRFPDN
jgi:hypothetical protein